MSASSYGGEKNQIRGEIQLSRHLAMTTPQLGNQVLVVDDLVDSGVSLQVTLDWLKQHYPDIIEIRSAVLWRKDCSIITPDYYVYYLKDNPWIHQPFEQYEQMSVEDLVKDGSQFQFSPESK
jgi:hypothetical protein